MSEVELRLLGDFEVLRNGKAHALPASRKTRALAPAEARAPFPGPFEAPNVQSNLEVTGQPGSVSLYWPNGVTHLGLRKFIFSSSLNLPGKVGSGMDSGFVRFISLRG